MLVGGGAGYREHHVSNRKALADGNLQIFAIVASLHPILLSPYHGGVWRIKTSIDGKVISDMIVDEVGATSRTLRVSQLTYQSVEGVMTGELQFTKLV